MSVLCAGILVADVFVPPLARLPAGGELLATSDFLLQPGGCAANTALGAARQGLPVSVIGRVGNDPFGEFVEGALRARGIDTAGVRPAPGLATSKTVILSVAGDDRRYIHTFGANAALGADDIPDEVIAAARVLYVGGYLVLPGLERGALAERLRLARTLGVRTVLDPVVPADRPELSAADLEEVLAYTDVFVPNEDEGRALTGEADPYRQAERFLELGAAAVVVKRGGRGALAKAADEAFELPAPSVEVVEPSGAGDAFAAGLVLGLVEGWSLERSVSFASVLGGSACTALGCTAGVFTRAQAEAFLDENPLEARAAVPA